MHHPAQRRPDQPHASYAALADEFREEERLLKRIRATNFDLPTSIPRSAEINELRPISIALSKLAAKIIGVLEKT